MSSIYAGEVAAAAILASRHAGSAGEAYNITDQGPITQREYFDLWAEACGVQPPRRRVPFGLVWTAATVLEAHGRLLRRSRPPLISRYATWLMGRRLSYSTAKAHSRLGWAPSLSYRDSIARTVRWYLAQEPNALGAKAKALV
jgi:nucleoside-diphosphate-sugar epimerase